MPSLRLPGRLSCADEVGNGRRPESRKRDRGREATSAAATARHICTCTWLTPLLSLSAASNIYAQWTLQPAQYLLSHETSTRRGRHGSVVGGSPERLDATINNCMPHQLLTEMLFVISGSKKQETATLPAGERARSCRQVSSSAAMLRGDQVMSRCLVETRAGEMSRRKVWESARLETRGRFGG